MSSCSNASLSVCVGALLMANIFFLIGVYLILFFIVIHF